MEKIGQLINGKQVSDLHKVLRPYIIQIMKDEVENSLPTREETILEVSITEIQNTYYKAMNENNTSFLLKGAKPDSYTSLTNATMELRKGYNQLLIICRSE